MYTGTGLEKFSESKANAWWVTSLSAVFLVINWELNGV